MEASMVMDNEAIKRITHLLSVLLADTYLLYLKTQNFHWNVEDSRFHSLHEMFEKQYSSLAEAIDEIAERIRMLGEKSPGTMRQFLELTTISEADSDLSGDQMIQTLMADHETLTHHLRPMIKEASDLNDEGSADMFISRLRFHEKTAWMLRSHK